MPTSAQSAVSASARLSVDGSEGDREPARDNVFPFDVNDHRSTGPCPWSLDRDARRVDGDELAFDHRLRLAGPIPNVDSPAVESLVVPVAAERPLRAGRRDLEVIRTIDQVRMVEQRSRDTAHALAVFDGD